MSKLLQGAQWLHGTPKEFLGPKISSLVPLNFFGGVFAHSHSDAAMRILHGYTSLGLLYVAYSLIVVISMRLTPITTRAGYSILLAISITCLYANAWITINGMGIPYGRQFHFFLALLFATNYFVVQNASKKMAPLSKRSTARSSGIA